MIANVKKTMMIALFALMMVPATVMQADARPGKGPNGLNGRPGMFKGLDLTENQIDLLKADRMSRHKRVIRLKGDLETLRLDLAEAASVKSPNTQKIDRLSNKIGNVKGRIIAERTKGIIYLRSILTAEQKRKMDTRRLILGMMKERRDGRFGR